MRFSKHAGWRTVSFAVLAVIALSTYATAETARQFDVEAGPASQSLKRFAKQAKLGIVYDPRDVKGVQTHSVAGLLIPSEALRRMLENTSLVFDQDEETGAFAVTPVETPSEGDALAEGNGGVGLASSNRTAGDRVANNEPETATPMTENKRKLSGAFKGLVSLIAIGGWMEISAQDDEIFELSPFTVDSSTDVGYRSSNTNSVSLISTAIKDTPVSIEVINGEVIRDLGLNDVNSVIDFATNAGNNEGDAGLQRNMNFRGLTTRFMRRNNFIWYTKTDNFSTERVEVVRGPAALLYGDGEPGGLVNITSKQANAQSNFGEVALTLGSEGERRATIDSNIAVVDNRFGVRVAGLKSDSDGWKDNTAIEKEGLFGSILFRPAKNLFLSAEAEIMDIKDDHGSIIPLYSPAGAAWSMPISDLGFVGNASIADGSINYDNLTSFHTNFNRLHQKWENYMFKAEWTPIENLSIVASRNQYDQTTNQNRLNGAINVYGPGEGGNPLDEYAMKYYPERFLSHNEMNTTRIAATYAWDTGDTTQRFILGYIDESDAFFGEQQRPYDREANSFLSGGWHALADGPIDFKPSDIPSTHSEWGNDYFGIGWQKISPDGWTARPAWLAPAEWDLVRPETVPNWWWGPILDERVTKAKFGALQNEFLNGKLKTLVGYREDNYSKYNTRFESRDLKDEAKEDSINAGFTYQVSEQVNAYFNYSETFKAAGSFRRDPFNQQLNPAQGEGIEGGLKFDLSRGWSGIVTYYTTDFLGDAVQMSGVDRDIIDPNGINSRNGSNWVQADTQSDGFEIQAVGSPIENLTVSLGFAYTDARIGADTEYQIMFNDGFRAGANGNPVDADGNPLMIGEGEDAREVTLNDIELDEYGRITNAGDLGLVGSGEKGLFVNQVTGQPTGFHNAVNGGERTAPYAGISFNGWGRYSFTEGPMKNWFVGGHFRSTMNNYAGYTGSVASGNRTGHTRPDYTLLGAFAGFEKAYDTHTFRAQLNIDNLLDKEYEFGFYAARWLQAPRTFKLTTTFSF